MRDGIAVEIHKAANGYIVKMTLDYNQPQLDRDWHVRQQYVFTDFSELSLWLLTHFETGRKEEEPT